MNGLILFARYAFMPNKLGFCGPEDNRTIFDSVIKNKPDKNLRKILYQFPGALLYLNRIAEKVKINDIFNERVVEAYFLGNSLLSKVESKANHQFHVFNLFPFTVKLRRTLKNMDRCRISWGKVLKILKDKLEVEFQPLTTTNRRMKLGKPKSGLILYKIDRKSFVPKIRVGDFISFHWNWTCQILNQKELENLKKYTEYHLNLANAPNR